MVARLEMILAVFSQEERGAEVLAELRKTEKEGRLQLHNAAVLYKSASGGITVSENGPDSPRWSAFFSSLVNQLGGLLSRPANATIGKAAGVVTGGAAGNGADLGFDLETLNGLKDALPEKSSALLTVTEDQWIDALVKALENQECTIYRQNLRQSFASQVRESQNDGNELPSPAGGS